MAIKIVAQTEEWKDAIHAFNLRMNAGGSVWSWYEDHTPDWIPYAEGEHVWREYHLAIEGDDVRGGYGLKPQDFWLNGEIRRVTDWQGPMTEGDISRHYGALGLRLVRHMLKQQPLLYSFGHGGYDAPMVNMLRSLKWWLHDTSVCVLVVRPGRFLRLNAYLRDTPRRRLALDALAFSGVGYLGFKALHGMLALRGLRQRNAVAEEVAAFGPWADDVWEANYKKYTGVAVRDQQTLNRLMPPGQWPKVVRLRVYRGAETIGWAAVMRRQMQDDPRFGSLSVGSVVDVFGDPADSAEIICAATRYLRQFPLDIIISNQSHPKWIEGFTRTGYLNLEKRRIFAACPELKAAFEPVEENVKGLHLTNMDGHGPHGL